MPTFCSLPTHITSSAHLPWADGNAAAPAVGPGSVLHAVMCSEVSLSTTLTGPGADVTLLALLQVMTGDDRKMMYLANPENGKKVVSAAEVCRDKRMLGYQSTAGRHSREQAAGWNEPQPPCRCRDTSPCRMHFGTVSHTHKCTYSIQSRLVHDKDDRVVVCVYIDLLLLLPCRWSRMAATGVTVMASMLRRLSTGT